MTPEHQVASQLSAFSITIFVSSRLAKMDSFIVNEQPIPCVIHADQHTMSCLKSQTNDRGLEIPFEVTVFLNKCLLKETRRLDQRKMTTTSVHETLRQRIREEFEVCDVESIRAFADARSVSTALINTTIAICDCEERQVKMNPQVLDSENIWDDYDARKLLRAFAPDARASLATALDMWLFNTPAFSEDTHLPEIFVYRLLLPVVRTVVLKFVDKCEEEMVEEAEDASLALTRTIFMRICTFV